MNYFLLGLEKMGVLAAFVVVGIVVKKVGWLSDKGEEDLNRLILDLFWPALIFSSIVEKLTASDIVDNLVLPLLAAVLCLTGYGLGRIAVKVFGFKDDTEKIFLHQATFNNFAFMVLPFAVTFFPEKGAGLLFIHNLGIIILIWTLGVAIFTGRLSLKETVSNLLTPGLIVTFISMGIALVGGRRFIPPFVFQVADALGSPTVAVSMLLVGARVYQLGRHSFKFNKFTISQGVLRLILVPGLLFLFTMLLKSLFGLSREILVLFMLVNIMPVAINSLNFAIRYKSSPNLAVQGIIFTHLFAILTIPVFLFLIVTFF